MSSSRTNFTTFLLVYSQKFDSRAKKKIAGVHENKIASVLIKSNLLPRFLTMVAEMMAFKKSI